MAYVLTDGNNNVVAYPYSLAQLKSDNPNVSFPASPSNSELANWNVFPVNGATQPSYNLINDNLAEGAPVYSAGTWTQTWVVTPATAQEIADRTAMYETSSVLEANRLLAETDKYWIEAFELGKGIHVDLKNYRAALENPSALPGYPASTVYPTFPSNIFDTKTNLPIDVYDKTYIDGLVTTVTGAINGKLSLGGGTMTGGINMGGNRVSDLPTPTVDDDAANKKYVDDAVAAGGGSGNYLPLTGGTLTGNLYSFSQSMGDPWMIADTGSEHVRVTDLTNFVDVAANMVHLVNNGTGDDTRINADTTTVSNGASGNSVTIADGAVSVQDSTGSAIMPLADYHLASKAYVDALTSSSPGLAWKNHYVQNVDGYGGNGVGTPIQDVINSIGTSNNHMIWLNVGEYREVGPITFNNMYNIQMAGVPAAGGSDCKITGGITISNANGIRLQAMQVVGASSIQCRSIGGGNGHYLKDVDFVGNVTISGTGGFMIFTDCSFEANVTIDAAFTGVVYFIRCAFSGASATYAFNQTSPLQALISDSSGIPTAGITKASFSGMITYKNNTQKQWINGIPVNLTTGLTNGNVLQVVTGTATEIKPVALNYVGAWTLVQSHTTGGAKTLPSTWNSFKSTYKDFMLIAIASDGHTVSTFMPTAVVATGRTFDVYHAHGNAYVVLNGITDLTTAAYTLTMDASFSSVLIYAR